MRLREQRLWLGPPLSALDFEFGNAALQIVSFVVVGQGV